MQAHCVGLCPTTQLEPGHPIIRWASPFLEPGHPILRWASPFHTAGSPGRRASASSRTWIPMVRCLGCCQSIVFVTCMMETLESTHERGRAGDGMISRHETCISEHDFRLIAGFGSRNLSAEVGTEQAVKRWSHSHISLTLPFTHSLSLSLFFYISLSRYLTCFTLIK